MRKFIGFSIALAMIFSVMVVHAKVWYEMDGDKVICYIDHEDGGYAALNVIGTMTGNWKEPGEPMYKNDAGRWEYKFEMQRAKEFYKFYDPSKSGDPAYFEDPEADEEVANPFGSKNAVLRKSRAGGGAAAGPAEEEYPQLSFGMWSRNTYNMVFKSQMSQRVSYKNDGSVDDGKVVVLAKDAKEVKEPKTGYAVEDVNLGHRWEGEMGSTAGNATRVWLDSTKLRSSSTFKVHGKVFKHMQLDTEVNFNGTVETGYADYWKAGTADARVEALNKIQRNAASQYMGLVFGPFATNGAWGRWVGERTKTWDNSPVNNTIWIDQIVISFPFDDVEAKVGILGNNGATSKDPMNLFSGKRVGWKEDIGTNLEFYIHPTKVKNLNVLVGAAHTWRDMSIEKGEGEVWYTGSRVDNSDRKYLAYLNADYKIGFVDFGAMWYWNSWSVSALDMFMNGDMTVSAWVKLRPIKGLAIEAQLATNLSTIYLDEVKGNDNFYDWATYRTKKEEWDLFANSAVLFGVSYLYENLLNVGASLKAAGTLFKGTLGNEDGQFSGWWDSARRVNGITNYGAGMSPYYYNDRGATILTTLDISVDPMQNKLIRFGTKEELAIGKLDSPLMTDVYDFKNAAKANGYQAQKRQIDLLSSPFVGTSIGNLSAELGVTFSYTNYQDETLKIGSEQLIDSANMFTFNKAYLQLAYGNISDILKSVELNYAMEIGYYDGFYQKTTEEIWDVMKNTAQVSRMYNEVSATLYFANDISLGLGFIVRNYFGDQDNGNIYNKLDPNLIEKMSVNALKDYTSDLGISSSKDVVEAYYAQRKDYWNIGGALQFKYTINNEAIQYPTIFVNLGLGWNPFDDDGDSTMNWYKNGDNWDVDNTGWTEETSVFTIGIQWDF